MNWPVLLAGLIVASTLVAGFVVANRSDDPFEVATFVGSGRDCFRSDLTAPLAQKMGGLPLPIDAYLGLGFGRDVALRGRKRQRLVGIARYRPVPIVQRMMVDFTQRRQIREIVRPTL